MGRREWGTGKKEGLLWDLPLTDDIRAGIAKNVADLEAEAAAVKAFVPA